MFYKKPYMIPVNPHTTEEKTNEIVGKQVTPMAAVGERAKKINGGNARKYSTCSGRQYKSGEQSEISQISISQEEKGNKNTIKHYV